ncbi:MAG: hypothetical protein IPM97_05145 [Bdellovibrionaceae bacterium]|nr:hypothetical protein [Pseudobdellovibrionaceae bacterium]
MAFTRSLFVLLISLSSLSSQAQYKIENWHPEIRASKDSILELVKNSADDSIQKIAKVRACKGQIVSVYLSPSSFIQNETAESYKIYYQLSYNQNQCTNKLLVTCGARVSNSAGTLSVSKSTCRSYPVKDYASPYDDRLANPPPESPDSTKDSNDDIIDEGLHDPRRGGNDVERGFEGGF